MFVSVATRQIVCEVKGASLYNHEWTVCAVQQSDSDAF